MELWREADWFDRAMMAIIAVVVGFILLAVGMLIYNGRSVTGVIVDKDFSESHYVTEMQCMPKPSGGCNMVPYQRYVPDTWSVDVQPDDGSDVVYREVSEEYWEQVGVGDRWSDK